MVAGTMKAEEEDAEPFFSDMETLMNQSRRSTRSTRQTRDFNNSIVKMELDESKDKVGKGCCTIY
jgi:hypothetical protein